MHLRAGTLAASVALVALALPGLAAADDGVTEKGVGGIVLGKTDRVAMVHEQLDVGCSQIRVSFDFLNESDGDVTHDLIFPLPAYPAFLSGMDYPAGAPADFTIAVDGRPAPFHTLVRATVHGKDVTARLLSAGLSREQIARFPFDQEDGPKKTPRRPATPAQMAALKQAGLLDQDDEATWNTHVHYQWRQTFPAHRVVHVEHSYQPFIAGGTDSGYYGAAEQYTKARMHRFCATPRQTARLEKLFADEASRDPYGGIPGTIIDYVLTTANTWKDGIRDFTLRIHTGSPDEVVATCFPATFRKRPGNVLEAHLKNFHPAGDLRVYIGNMRDCPGDDNWGAPPIYR
ncbi:MAG TPA: DUF4424 family protein [Xanthomonadaceae bacterium]|jgi:hypothetical protein